MTSIAFAQPGPMISLPGLSLVCFDYVPDFYGQIGIFLTAWMQAFAYDTLSSDSQPERSSHTNLIVCTHIALALNRGGYELHEFTWLLW